MLRPEIRSVPAGSECDTNKQTAADECRLQLFAISLCVKRKRTRTFVAQFAKNCVTQSALRIEIRTHPRIPSCTRFLLDVGTIRHRSRVLRESSSRLLIPRCHRMPNDPRLSLRPDHGPGSLLRCEFAQGAYTPENCGMAYRVYHSHIPAPNVN